MAVEQAIAPHRKTELHARLLAELQDDGADPAVLAHHADGPATPRPSGGTRWPRRAGQRN